MFKNAKTLDSTVKTGAGRKKEREQVQMTGIEQLAHLDAIIKAASAAKEALESGLRETIMDHFMAEIAGTHKKPESFNAVEGLAEANIQMRKRGSNSALNEEEQRLLDTHKIPYHREVITPELFAINPAYATDSKLLERVEKALAKIAPDDFIVKQEEKSKFVVDDNCLEAALKNGDQALVEATTTIAFKPKLTEVNVADLAKTASEILNVQIQSPAADEPAAPAKKTTRRGSK